VLISIFLRTRLLKLGFNWTFNRRTTAWRRKKDLVVHFDPLYLALGSNENERQAAYAAYVLGTVPDNELKLIRESLQRGQVTGSERFREEISLRKRGQIYF